MQKNAVRNYIIGAVILIILILIIWALRGNTSPISNSQNDINQPNVLASDTPSSNSSANPKTPVTSGSISTTGSKATAPKSTGSSGGTFMDSIKAREDANTKCVTAADIQYRKQYAGLYSSESYSSYINKSSTGCYIKISGSTQKAYSTSTTVFLFFANVYQNQIIAQCSNPGGPTATNQWQCENKITGQAIIRQQYDELINKYLLQ
jgi:hypothetical protein